MGLKDKWIDEEYEALTLALEWLDVVGANHACMKLREYCAPGLAELALGRAWLEATGLIFDRSVDEAVVDEGGDEEDYGDIDHEKRLVVDMLEIDEMSRLAVRMARRHGGVDALKAQAQDLASALVDSADFIKRIAEHEEFSLGANNVDIGQRSFIASISLAVALEDGGVGFDKVEKREFAVKFFDWLSSEFAELTEHGEMLFLGHVDEFDQAYFQEEFGGPVRFMASLRSAMASKAIDSVSAPGRDSKGASSL